VLSVFVRAFRTPDLRKKLLFTGAMIVLFRFGSNLPAPGISEQNVSYCSRMSSSGGVFAILNLLSGNSLLHLTVFAIGILPYITASIIVQMLTQVIPRLETLRKDGQAGQAKITQYTRYVTVGLGLVYAVVYVQAARTGAAFPGSGCGPAFHPLIPNPTPVTIGTMVITMVSGTAVIMWMGELITDRGVGNGMSVLMFTSIVAVIPGEIEQIYLVAMLPLVALDKIGLGQDLLLSGVSLLIMVSVGLDTVKQIQSQLEQHSYEGFLR
jgi:preprotein translocase subunit SecY